MIWLYNIAITLFSPIWVPWMLWRAKRRKEPVDWKQRTGELKIQMRQGSRRIWFHAVSVGEVVASLPILREIRSFAPDAEIVLSVTTSSGHATAEDRATGLYDHLVYFPIDVPRFVLGSLVKVKPQVVAIMETELWFNFLWGAKSLKATTMLVNGRISDRSYPRSLKLQFLYESLLHELDFALMQSETDAYRIKHLGHKSPEVLGNCKFDEALAGTDADPAAWRQELGIAPDAFVVVVGSTRSDLEEDLVISALRDPRLAGIQVVHAPRHLERAEQLAAKAKEFGVGLRSRKETAPYLILDTYGELSNVYSVADVVVVGGGFDKLGGQNILQPLAHGKPVIHGPNMQNFRDASELAARARATATANTSQELADIIAGLKDDPAKRDAMGSAAAELVKAHVGASRRYAERIVAALPEAP